MADTLEGTCLCGGVEYEVEDPQALGYCHCTRCQHWTGSSLAGVVVAKENFKFTKGDDLVKTYETHLAPRNFCSNCGSSIFDDLGAVYFVAAGLMGDLDMEPSFHQQVAYKAVVPDRRQRAAVRRDAAGLSARALHGIRNAKRPAGPGAVARAMLGVGG